MTFYIIGHLCIDEVIINGNPLPISMGGTAAFSSIICSRLLFPESASIVTKIGPDFPDSFLLRLNNFNVNTRYIYRVKRHSTRYLLDYVNDKRKLTLKSVCAPITKDDLPEEIYSAKLIYFGPIANEIPIETIITTKQKSKSLVALDIQGIIRYRDKTGKLYFKSNSKIDEMLSYIDIVKLDLAEAEIITGASKLRNITYYLSNLGVKLFIITKSRKGAILFFEGKVIKIPALILKQIYNTTGAGDCFFSSFLIEYIKKRDPIQAIQFASKAVSYLIGSPNGVQSFAVNGDIYTIIEYFTEENRIK